MEGIEAEIESKSIEKSVEIKEVQTPKQKKPRSQAQKDAFEKARKKRAENLLKKKAEEEEYEEEDEVVEPVNNYYYYGEPPPNPLGSPKQTYREPEPSPEGSIDEEYEDYREEIEYPPTEPQLKYRFA